MQKYRIFVSAVQKELRKERLAIEALVSENAFLGKHFEVFLFEGLPARGKSTSKTYLKEVDASDVYLGIFGVEYGAQGHDGLSATEREFRRSVKMGKEILIFIKGKDDSKRDDKLRKL